MVWRRDLYDSIIIASQKRTTLVVPFDVSGGFHNSLSWSCSNAGGGVGARSQSNEEDHPWRETLLFISIELAIRTSAWPVSIVYTIFILTQLCLEGARLVTLISACWLSFLRRDKATFPFCLSRALVLPFPPIWPFDLHAGSLSLKMWVILHRPSSCIRPLWQRH